MLSDEFKESLRREVRRNRRDREQSQRKRAEQTAIADITNRALRRMSEERRQDRTPMQEQRQKLRDDIWHEKDREYAKVYYRGTTQKKHRAATMGLLPFWPRSWRNPKTLLWTRLDLHIRYAYFYFLSGPDMRKAMIELRKAVDNWPAYSYYLSSFEVRRANSLMEEILETMREANRQVGTQKPVEEARTLVRLAQEWADLMENRPLQEESEEAAPNEAPADQPEVTNFKSLRQNMVLLHSSLNDGYLKMELAKMLIMFDIWVELRDQVTNNKRRNGDYWIRQISEACGKMAQDDTLKSSHQAQKQLSSMIAGIRNRLNEKTDSVTAAKIQSFMGDLSALERQVR
jgi:hypothetical protein